MNRGNIETREAFVKRSVGWWIERGHKEIKNSKQLFEGFFNRWNISDYITSNSTVLEVGPGPFGGILQILSVSCGKKIFLDYVMQELMDLKYISWPQDALYCSSPAEYMELEDNEADVLLSYNCLDHGWDIWRAIKECVRVSKYCFINFDCRRNDPQELISHSKEFYISHYQMMHTKDVEKFLKSFESKSLRILRSYAPICHSFPSAELFIEKII